MSERFYRINKNDNTVIVRNPTQGCLLVFFSDIGGRYGMPFSELFNTVGDLPASIVFMQDPHRLWFHLGIKGIGGTIEAVAQYVKHFAVREDTKRIITAGYSGGGYAAILIGLLAGADEVHAFGPQTRLLQRRDSRYPDKIDRLHTMGRGDLRCLDLRQVLSRRSSIQTNIHIYYSLFDKRDRRHARNLASFEHVRAIGYPIVGHNIMRVFKDNGALTDILMAAVQGRTGTLSHITLHQIVLDFIKTLLRRLQMSFGRQRK